MTVRKKTHPAIAIIGAGPAGLAAAHDLKKRGFRDVTVFEKQGRVGGLCRSITVDGLSFDLGANYVTAAYDRTLAIAEDVGAETFVAKGIDLAVVRANDILWNPAPSGDPNELRRGMETYIEVRKGLAEQLDGPVMKDLGSANLLVSLEKWLRDQELEILEPVFWIPIVTMGYGYLSEIPAPYALKFMSPLTFLPIYLRVLEALQSNHDEVESVVPWPKKFKGGFQRLWERVAWDLDVRLDVQIESIQRTKRGKLKMRFTQLVSNHYEQRREPDDRTFDALILACPLDQLDFLDIGTEEKNIFEKISFNSYVVSSYYLEHPIEEIKGQAVAFVPPGELGEPFAIGQTWKSEGSAFIQFFNRVPPDWDQSETREQVSKCNEALLEKIPAVIDRNETWTFDRWPYFRHFELEDLECLEDIESMQGKRSTYYAGSGSHFELVESAVEHAEHVVTRLCERFAP